MRTLILLLALASATGLRAQALCNDFGNLILVTNYDGGPLDIVVDEDIPDLKIGLSSYEPMTVTISGPYAGNVTEVWYAGFNSSANNNHCAVIPTTTISAPAGAAVTIETYPPVTLADPAGRTNMIYAYQCSATPSSGNTPAQIVHYFASQMGAVLRWHRTQYGCYFTVNVSAGGNCCEGVCTLNPTAAQDQSICRGDSVALAVSAPGGSVTWSPAGSLDDPGSFAPTAFPDSTTTYVALVVDGDGCFGTDSQTITVLPTPVAPTLTLGAGDTLFADPADGAFTWFLDGNPLPDTGAVLVAPVPGEYTAIRTVDGCASAASAPLTVLPQPEGLEGLSGPGWRLYPNPAGGAFRLLGPRGAPTAPLRVHDALGRVLRVLRPSAEGLYDPSDLPAGAYRVSVEGLPGSLPLWRP